MTTVWVTYNGVNYPFDVAAHHHWIAVDKNGEVCSYDTEPWPEDDEYWYNGHTIQTDHVNYLGRLPGDCDDWETQLAKIHHKPLISSVGVRA